MCLTSGPPCKNFFIIPCFQLQDDFFDSPSFALELLPPLGPPPWVLATCYLFISSSLFQATLDLKPTRNDCPFPTLLNFSRTRATPHHLGVSSPRLSFSAPVSGPTLAEDCFGPKRREMWTTLAKRGYMEGPHHH
jgi:hypothetical protein